MCFSAEASFTGAALLSAFGIATLRLAKHHKHLLLLACVPLLFGLQQAGEGFVWLGLEGVVSPAAMEQGKNLFLTFAYAVWPIYISIAMYFAEVIPWRKYLMLACAFFGVAVVTSIFTTFSLSDSSPQIIGHSIRYIKEPLLTYRLIYLAAVVVPFFLSSLAYTSIFGALIAAAFFITDYLYFVDFTSTWCFFGAIFSVSIYWVVKKVVASSGLDEKGISC